MVLAYLKSLLTSSRASSKYTLLLPNSGQTGNSGDSRPPSTEPSRSVESLEKGGPTAPPLPSSSNPLLRRIDPRIISDATIGLSDGLTVPFALTAGLSALGNTQLVVYAGLAELIAGAISMGLGGYLGAASERYAY